MRITLVAGLCAVVIACDPIGFGAIQVAPAPTANADSTAQHAFAAVARITARRGMQPFDVALQDYKGWTECFNRSTLFICGKLRSGEAQFQLWQSHRLGKEALNIKLELLDSLRSQFGTVRVGECKWVDEQSPDLTGCVPLRPNSFQ
jgi:hypothetical protein